MLCKSMRLNNRENYLILQEMVKVERRSGQPWPAARGSHAACCLGFGSERPQLLIVGGIDSSNKTIGDAWIFDFYSQSWREVSKLHVFIMTSIIVIILTTPK